MVYIRSVDREVYLFVVGVFFYVGGGESCVNLFDYVLYFCVGSMWCCFGYKVDVECIIEVFMEVVGCVEGEYMVSYDIGVVSQGICFFYVVSCEEDRVIRDGICECFLYDVFRCSVKI